MNERIQELAEQSGVTVLTTHGMKDVVDGCYIVGPAHLQKFAELIVRECINEIHAADVGNLKAKSYYLDKVAEHIEKYFGVEE